MNYAVTPRQLVQNIAQHLHIMLIHKLNYSHIHYVTYTETTSKKNNVNYRSVWPISFHFNNTIMNICIPAALAKIIYAFLVAVN